MAARFKLVVGQHWFEEIAKELSEVARAEFSDLRDEAKIPVKRWDHRPVKVRPPRPPVQHSH